MSRTWAPLTIRFSARKSAVDVWWMIGFMPAVGELVRCTDGRWMIRPPQHCPRGHRLSPGRVLVGHRVCSCGGHTTWTCDCGAVVYAPPLDPECRVLVGPAAVR